MTTVFKYLESIVKSYKQIEINGTVQRWNRYLGRRWVLCHWRLVLGRGWMTTWWNIVEEFLAFLWFWTRSRAGKLEPLVNRFNWNTAMLIHLCIFYSCFMFQWQSWIVWQEPYCKSWKYLLSGQFYKTFTSRWTGWPWRSLLALRQYAMVFFGILKMSFSF
jgi:hypothetical protein